MSKLTEANIIREFQDFDIPLEYGSTKLDKLVEFGIKYHYDAAELLNHWVAFSAKHGDCAMDTESMDQWEGILSSNNKKTPLSRRTASKTGNGTMFTGSDLNELFGSDDVNVVDEDLLGAYGTPEDKVRLRGQKRTVGQTTPTTPTPSSKSRHTHNGATPLTPRPTHQVSNGSTLATPVRSTLNSSMVSSTPAAKYNQRQNSGNVVCTLNENSLPQSWRGATGSVDVAHYDQETALKAPYQYMFQKVSEKALTLIERVEVLGDVICRENSLPEPLSVAQPSLEPAVFTGQVVCEGEGHLNARSCLLEGPIKTRRSKGISVKLDIPDHVTCSLFPGQVIAVEGINNYNGVLIPSTVYDEGVVPPPPKRPSKLMSGFTLLAAAGPFSTSDSLEMEPLNDLLEVVKMERPNVLLLLGPFVDSTHPHIKECDLPSDMTFDEFFKKRVLTPVYQCTRSFNTTLILVPSQRDVHHQWQVYPQPPFQVQKDLVFSAPDPATLSINGLCVGMTSTDILFHLSARTMFKGPTGDRMARVARHILCQQSFYPLVPAFQREDGSSSKKGEKDTEKNQPPFAESTTEVNLDLIHGLDYQHAMLPVRPDLLLLPSDLKPFAKKMDGCVCINPGRLTKKASGGTFVKIRVPDVSAEKTDFSSDIAVQVVYI